jgi:signal transduction histidine kinase
MSLKIALILSVILQFSAAIIAMTLIRRTRTNIAWWLISAGFLLMAIRRVFEIIQVFNPEDEISNWLVSSWIAVVISMIMLLSLIFIRRIFNLQKQIDELRKQNESSVLSAILKTEENERQHFAKELHDGLGPLLSSVKMTLSASRYKGKNNEELLLNAEKLIDESIGTLKDISNKLSPHVLVNMGLHRAVKSFINRLQIIGNPQIRFNSNIENKRFPHNVEMVLYRIACELITNTLRHANAHHIYIDLMTEGNILTLKYIDDGIGFDTRKAGAGQPTLGFFNIQSRIKSLNGSFDLFSEPGEGMQVDIMIRIEKNEKD